MNRNFQRALQLVLQSEGGWAHDPDDRGGATNRGITISTARLYIDRDFTIENLKHITTEQVAKVYKGHYWDAVKGDSLPDGVDYATFDFAVNSGTGRASRYLQEVVGAIIDGQIGPHTLLAVKGRPKAYVIDGLCAKRSAFLHRLAKTPRQHKFEKGWENRVERVRIAANKIAALGALGKLPG